MPVSKHAGVINQLCWYLETIDFNLKYNVKKVDCEKFYPVFIDSSIKKDNDRFEKMVELYKEFNKKKNNHYMKVARSNYKNKGRSVGTYNENENDYCNALDEFYTLIRNKAYEICSNQNELANYAAEIVYILNPTKEKDFAWNVTKEGLMDNIKKNRKINITLPVRDKDGEDYLGQKYILKGLYGDNI